MGSAGDGVCSGSAAKDVCSAVGDIHSGSCCKRCMFCGEGYVFWFCCGTFALAGKCSGFGWQEYAAAETKI